MRLTLHANATTTPRTRAYIQQSSASTAALARELGIHSRTVARWKGRQDVADRSTRPHRLATTMTAWEEGLTVELRRSLALPLDDILEAMRRCLNPKLSRSGIHRCLQRHGLSAGLTPQKAPAVTFQTDAPAGFIHVDVNYLPPLNRRRSYAYVAIDRATRFVYLEILPDRRAETAAGFLARFLDSFPLEVHTILTDNGSEFTDRFAVDKKAKPQDKPSGEHPFDRICAERAITHRLTQPFRPQTNGMVERFNRRLGEHLNRVPQNRAAHHRRFLDHAERDAYLHTFVADYNRTRLRCIDYQAPAELLAKLTGHNTKAGGGSGLEQALAAVWGDVPTQRCTVHKHRNLLAHAPQRLHEEVSADYTDMLYAASPTEIEERRRAFIRKWRLKCKAVADSLEEAGDRLFTFIRLPSSQWKSARTTNAIEGLHEEFKRRIKTQTVLPSAETAAMLFWALLAAGQITMRKVDGWQTLTQKLAEKPIDLAA